MQDEAPTHNFCGGFERVNGGKNDSEIWRRREKEWMKRLKKSFWRRRWWQLETTEGEENMQNSKDARYPSCPTKQATNSPSLFLHWALLKIAYQTCVTRDETLPPLPYLSTRLVRHKRLQKKKTLIPPLSCGSSSSYIHSGWTGRRIAKLIQIQMYV